MKQGNILISFLIIFNGGNYDMYPQLNFVLVGSFFLYCFTDLNYKAHIKKFFFENKKIVVPQDDKRVLYQLSYLKRAYTEEGKLKVKVEEGTKDDHADALALACNAVSFGGGWYYVEHGDGWKSIMG